VPLDRDDPAGKEIPIAFQVLPHRDHSPPARDAIFVTAGGPGESATADRDTWASILDPLLDSRDLVVVDNRGTGGSGAIDCPDLQNGFSAGDELAKAVTRDVPPDVKVIAELRGRYDTDQLSALKS
jgi:pimeloyl-ACP methyl ester carboxylesterase